MFHCNSESFYTEEHQIMNMLFSSPSVLEHEPGETVPLVVRQTIEYIKNQGRSIFRGAESSVQ